MSGGCVRAALPLREVPRRGSQTQPGQKKTGGESAMLWLPPTALLDTRYAAMMRASESAFKSPGAIGLPSNGSPQHNRGFFTFRNFGGLSATVRVGTRY
ncbi:hypothetical protein llap_13978 [Limosa lapponica baueri]|uniref:Uncharacterized protein n=1 Tax=Limosa lapponica baueri TaxID=1758121 RepID=A0A2I0TPI6_LIMLA|nr:hypothetical protein llap_13978 [Limosa lapponica baueri]